MANLEGGVHLPGLDQWARMSMRLESHRGNVTSIQRLPPLDHSGGAGRVSSTRMFRRGLGPGSNRAKAAFNQEWKQDRRGLKKMLLGNRSPSVLKWSILARNVGLSASLIYPIFGGFAIAWTAFRPVGAKSPIEQQLLNTYDFVGLLASAIGTLLYVCETCYGLEITAEKLFGFVLLYSACSVPGFFTNTLILPAALSMATAVLKMLSIVRAEEGRLKVKERILFSSCCIEWCSGHTYVLLLYLGLNAGAFAISFFYYFKVVMEPCLQTATDERSCISLVGVIAKGFGNTLNLNCSCTFLPVLRLLLSSCMKSNCCSARLNAQRLAAKNITVHRTIGWLIFVGVCGHVSCHYVNLGMRADVTIKLFGEYAIITGIMIAFVFALMLAGLEPTIKRAHYAVFWKTHYLFLPFILLLLAHAPHFWKWMAAPMVLFFIEKYYSKFVRGQMKFYILDVEYLHPVLTLKFRPERDEDFKFAEGQYLLINVPFVSEYEWHPFTISSAYDDLCQSENGYVSISMKVTGDGRWTDRVKDHLKELSGKMRFLKNEQGRYVRNDHGDLIPNPATRHTDFNSTHTRKDVNGNRFKSPFHHMDSKGKYRPGLLNGTDGKRLIYIDGPFQAPTQSYSHYDDVLLIGSGIGLTPASAILRAVLLYKWKKGFKPRTLRFYWMLAHQDIGSYRWFIRLISRLIASYEFDKRNGALKFDRSAEHENYIELNVYVTSTPEDYTVHPNVYGRGATRIEQPRSEVDEQIMQMQRDIGISEQYIHESLLHPAIPSSSQMEEQVYSRGCYPSNPEFNYLNFWVWKGRPVWEDIFKQVKAKTIELRKGGKVGVCFCGSPIISQQLKRQCRKRSSRKVRFYLHAETFG